MDVKSAFLYETIEEEVYVCQTLGFEDPDYPDMVYKVVKALYESHQAPRACTPIETEKPLLKDPDGEDVDVHIYRYLKGKPHLAYGILKILPLLWWHILIVTMLELALIGSPQHKMETQKEVAVIDAELQGRIDQDEVNAASKGVNAAEPTVFDN
nr:ribonuclease H-like domain, reverse transcriptase, RNA-dependent DNA polymerase [Tanacetum cinerariifolium]